MILRELIQRAVDIASSRQDTSVTRLSLETAAEPMLPLVFSSVAVRLARAERTRTMLRRTKSLSVANGSATLTSDVLTSYISDANLRDATDKTKQYSLTQWDQLVTDQLDPRLGHFAVEGEATLRVVEPNTAYSPTSGPTITLLLTVPCVPAIPAIGAAVVATDEVVEELISELAAQLTPK